MSKTTGFVGLQPHLGNGKCSRFIFAFVLKQILESSYYFHTQFNIQILIHIHIHIHTAFTFYVPIGIPNRISTPDFTFDKHTITQLLFTIFPHPIGNIENHTNFYRMPNIQIGLGKCDLSRYF